MTKTKMKKIDYSAGGDTCITRLPRDKKKKNNNNNNLVYGNLETTMGMHQSL
jgi:hypothetical protein